MTSSASSDQDAAPLWQYVAVTDYRPPSVTVEHAVRTGLSAFWQRFRTEAPPAAETPLKTEEELQSIPGALLERIAPTPDGWPAARALDEALATWLDRAPANQPVVFVLDPPHGTHSDILQVWAEIHEWRVLSPPAMDQLLGQAIDWIAGWSADSAPWVLPNLERCYLRHAHGLALVRRLLDQACSGALGRGVIGCDSWAWAFLRRAWPGATPPLLILQSFDQHCLARWFQSFAREAGMGDLIFRQADNGNYVLPPPTDTQNGSANSSDFLQQLAAYSGEFPASLIQAGAPACARFRTNHPQMPKRPKTLLSGRQRSGSHRGTDSSGQRRPPICCAKMPSCYTRCCCTMAYLLNGYRNCYRRPATLAWQRYATWKRLAWWSSGMTVFGKSRPWVTRSCGCS